MNGTCDCIKRRLHNFLGGGKTFLHLWTRPLLSAWLLYNFVSVVDNERIRNHGYE